MIYGVVWFVCVLLVGTVVAVALHRVEDMKENPLRFVPAVAFGVLWPIAVPLLLLALTLAWTSRKLENLLEKK